MTDDQSTQPFEETDILPPSLPPSPSAYAPLPAADTETAHPRVRSAGIVWGALFAVVAALALVFAVVPDRRADIRAWLLDLDPSTFNPGSVVGYAILAVGVALLLIAGAAIARRAAARA